MKEALTIITNIIEQYKQTDQPTGEQLNEWLKNLSAWLFYLEEQRAEAHERYEGILHNYTKEGYSVSKSKNEAEVQVPELYMLRRMMDAGYRVSDAMRTNISYLKTEKRNA
jgi:hypothetical protein